MGYDVPHIKPELITHSKEYLSPTEMVEITFWKVPESASHPEGVLYSCVYLKKIRTKFRRVLGFDNHEKKGHHKHFLGKEEKIIFINKNEMEERFRKCVKEIRGE